MDRKGAFFSKWNKNHTGEMERNSLAQDNFDLSRACPVSSFGLYFGSFHPAG